MARRQWHTPISTNNSCEKKKYVSTTKQYVRTCTATVQNQLNVFYSLQHTISVDQFSFDSFYSFIQSHGRGATASVSMYWSVLCVCVPNIAHTRRGFTGKHTAHTNNDSIRFALFTIPSHIVRHAHTRALNVCGRHQHTNTSNATRTTYDCLCLSPGRPYARTVRGSDDGMCVCWWRVCECEQEACPSMINSYLADKGVYKFISSARVSSTSWSSPHYRTIR